jgi:UrcA family protein
MLARLSGWYELVGTRDQLDPDPLTRARLEASHTHIAGDGDEHQPTLCMQERLMTTAASKLTTFRRSFAVAGVFAALAVTTTAFATPSSDAAPQVKVRYDDLNLATSAGVDILYRRISRAARAVCPDENSRDLGFVAAMQVCRANAVAQAVREVNNPQLALMHAARTVHG